MPDTDPADLCRHADMEFRDAVVYSCGHVYERCDFVRCTIVFNGPPNQFLDCDTHSCVFKLDLTIHDPEQWKHIKETILGVIEISMTQAALSKARKQQQQSPPTA
jgi:hypothetical protein